MNFTRPTILVGLCCFALGATPAHADDPDAEEPSAPQVQPESTPATGQFEIGVGFSPDEDFILHAAVVQEDLFRTGQRLALDAEVSSVAQRFSLQHDVRDLAGSGFDVRSELLSTRQRFPGFTREGVGGSVTVSRQLDRATRAYLGYRLEDVTMHLDEPTVLAAGSSPHRADLGGALQATLRAGLTYDTLGAGYGPRSGTRLDAYAEVADPRLGSERRFTRLGVSADHARPLGALTLRLHGDGGYILGPDGVPLSERWQHAGHADVRGYARGSVGMGLIGDHYLATGSDLTLNGRVELEAPLWRRAGLSVAVFGDAGLRYNADRAFGDTGAEFLPSVGVSVIWRSPIGPLRFDWAVPLDRESRRDGFSPAFLFSFGQSF
jgi:outer membrane protein insertion porin family